MKRETITTVAMLRAALEDLDPTMEVVVGAGMGYENPRMRTTTVRPVLVPNRFRYERDGLAVLVLGPTHG